jgi:hypothetical protein
VIRPSRSVITENTDSAAGSHVSPRGAEAVHLADVVGRPSIARQ